MRGYRKKEDALAKERILLTRKTMYAALLPHLKQGTQETDVWSFDWEQNAINTLQEKTEIEIQNELNEMKVFWDKIDLARKNKTDC